MSALALLNDACVTLGGRFVVRRVSLSVTPGEVVALLGPNGAGKTTLMRAALGLVPLSAGRVSLGGAEPARLAARERALRAAYLPQRANAVWPISVEALVALGRFAYGMPLDRLSCTDQAAVDAAIAACSLEALRTRRIDEISGGEKVRAHLARALAQQAPLLVLDEPTAGPDPAQALGVAEILRRHAGEGGAVLFSTHDIALAAHTADRVLLMAEGAALAEGPIRAALTTSALAAAYGRPGRLERVGGAFAAIFE